MVVLSDSTYLFNDAVDKMLKPNATVSSERYRYNVVKTLIRNRTSVVGVLKACTETRRTATSPHLQPEYVACKVYECCTEGLKEQIVCRSLVNTDCMVKLLDSFFYVPSSPRGLAKDGSKPCSRASDCSDEGSSSEGGGGGRDGCESPPYGVHVNVFEFHNTSLHRLLHRVEGPLNASVTSQLTRGLLQTVLILHSHGIVHGDIDSSNVFINEDGSVRLCDPGSSYQHPRLGVEKTPTAAGGPANLLSDNSLGTLLNSSRGEDTAPLPSATVGAPASGSMSERTEDCEPAIRAYLGASAHCPPENLDWVLNLLRQSARNRTLHRVMDRRRTEEQDLQSFVNQFRLLRVRAPASNHSKGHLLSETPPSEVCERVVIEKAPPLTSSHDDSSDDSDLEVPDESDASPCGSAASPTQTHESSSPELPGLDFIDLHYLLGDPSLRYPYLTGSAEYAPEPTADVWQIGMTVLEMTLGYRVLQLVDMFGEEEQSETATTSTRDFEENPTESTGAVMRAAMLIEEQLELLTSDWFLRQLVHSLHHERKISSSCADFVLLCLAQDPDQRPSVASLLKHDFVNTGAKVADRNKIVTTHLAKAGPDSTAQLSKTLSILQKIIVRKKQEQAEAAGDASQPESNGPADKFFKLFRNLSSVWSRSSVGSTIGNPQHPFTQGSSTIGALPPNVISGLVSNDCASTSQTAPTSEPLARSKSGGGDDAGGWLVPNE